MSFGNDGYLLPGSIVFVVSYGAGCYYHSPDDRMNTAGPLVCASAWDFEDREDAAEAARLLEGKLEAWMKRGDAFTMQVPLDAL